LRRALAVSAVLFAMVLPGGAPSHSARDPLRGLPVHDYDPDTTPLGGVVFFSGDGGWRSFDGTNGDSLRSLGYRVLGMDDLRLFANEMSGDTLAVVGRRLVDFLRAHLPRGAPVYLAGYSFGANIVADAAARGVESDGLYLLGPSRRGVRKITFGGFLNHEPDGPTSFDVAEQLNARGCVPAVFVTGDVDRAGKGAEVFAAVRRPSLQVFVAGAGHHYYGGDARYMRAARQALSWLATRRGSCAP